jgi:hypothetical protein
MHAYQVRPRKDDRGVDLISDALPIRRAQRERILDGEAVKFDSRLSS